MTGWFAANPYSYDFIDGRYYIHYFNHSTASLLKYIGDGSLTTNRNDTNALWDIRHAGTTSNCEMWVVALI